MYMCVKLFPRNLNPSSCSLYSISTYTCGVITAPKVCSNTLDNFFFFLREFQPMASAPDDISLSSD